jgi:transposase
MTKTTTGGKWLPDDIWEMVAPLIPPPKKRRRDGKGRPRLEDRKVLTGIIFVLRTGIPWRHMPPELGCGSGMTCLRRLREWHRKGVFQKLYEVLLAKLHSADKIDWSRAIIDSAKTKAPSGGGKTGSNPTDRRKLGSKIHVLVDAHGIPLAVSLTGANQHDMITQVLPLTDSVAPVRGKKRKTKKATQNSSRRPRL